MDVGMAVIQLKPNSMDQVKNWQETLQFRKDEAIATLKSEGVHIESWFHLELDGKDYLVAYMRADDIAEAQKIAKLSPFAIDQVHKAFKQNWAKGYKANLLLDLVNNE